LIIYLRKELFWAARGATGTVLAVKAGWGTRTQTNYWVVTATATAGTPLIPIAAVSVSVTIFLTHAIIRVSASTANLATAAIAGTGNPLAVWVDTFGSRDVGAFSM